MTTHRLRPWLPSLVALSAMQLGAPCGTPPPPSTPNMIRIETTEIVPITENYYVGFADVVIQTDEEFQAFDLTISWDPATLLFTNVSPHADFDDDSKFALPVGFFAATGSTTPVVDLRHGPSVTGTTRVASMVFIAPQGLPGWISVSGTVAAPDGTLIDVTQSNPVNVP